ncbi:MAG: ATP-binding protein [Bryobacteraceae bacterium]
MLVRVARYFLSISTALAIILLSRWLKLNTTTVALSLLMVVLATATFWGLALAIALSVTAVLAFNFFLIPPVGTFTVEDPQNWVALVAFLVTAATASQLSARAQRRAAEAQERSLETERLYELGRAILLNERFDRTLEQTAIDVARVFDLGEVAFYDAETKSTFRTGTSSLIPESELATALDTGTGIYSNGRSVTPVRLGGKPIGSLGLQGLSPMTETIVEAIANLAAISIERARAMERATAAEASKRSEELRAAMLDALAHDLKTPLTAIKASITALIWAPPRSAAGTRELLDIIHEETERLNQTVSETVQMARIDAGKLVLERHPHKIRDLIEDSLADVRPADIVSRVVIRIPHDLPDIDIDTDLMRQVLKQLIDNAAKYSPPAAPIEISAEAEGDSVIISVDDRGPGVNPDEQYKIFEKLYRGRHSSRTTEGTGMGLSIAKGIVEAHGGKIWVKSNQWGGAEFCIRLRTSDVQARA